MVDQIADKVCATMQLYDGKPSSREKDLVDLVVLAVTQEIDGAALAHAIDTEARRRRMEPFHRFAIPSTWGPIYERTARSVPYCADAADIGAARELATALVDPALDGTANGRTWRANERRWE